MIQNNIVWEELSTTRNQIEGLAEKFRKNNDDSEFDDLISYLDEALTQIEYSIDEFEERVGYWG